MGDWKGLRSEMMVMMLMDEILIVRLRIDGSDLERLPVDEI